MNSKPIRISLRALLIALTAFCVFLGSATHRAQKQRAAVKWARNMGEVVYEYEMLPMGSWKPTIWHRILGVDYFENVHYVRLNSFKVDDLSSLVDLPNIKVLDINYCKHVTDFSPLSRLKSLEDLKAVKTDIKDLNMISELTNLKSLDLRSTRIDDLGPLIQLNQLVSLNIGNTTIRDLQPIAEIPSLEYVHVSRTKIPIEDIRRLRNELPDCLIAY